MGIQILQLIGNRYAGFILTLIVIINLAIGSLVMNINSDLYPPFFPFDLNFFFRPVRQVHLWLYILLVTTTLFALNLTACFILDLIRWINHQNRTLKKTAALLFHGALLLALVAHLYEGFYGNSGQAILSNKNKVIPGIGEVKVLSTKRKTHPDGSLKDIIATIQIIRPDGDQIEQNISFNQPGIFEGGNREIIIQSAGKQPNGLILYEKERGERISLNFGEPKSMDGGELLLHGIFQSQMGFYFAQFTWTSLSGATENKIMVVGQSAGRHNEIKIMNDTYGLSEILEAPYVAALIRYNPAIPIILLSLFVILGGTILLIRFTIGGKPQ